MNQIKIYYCRAQEKQAPWQLMHEELYARELTALRCFGGFVSVEQLRSLHNCFVMLGHPDLTFHPAVLDRRARKMFTLMQSNGTAANPFVYQVNPAEEKKQLQRGVDISLVAHPTHAQALKGITKSVATVGFPIEVTKVTEVPRRLNSVIIGGRITPDKNVNVALWMLLPILQARSGMHVTVAYPPNNELLLKYYNVDAWQALGVQFITSDYDDFQQLLAQHEFYLCCSFGDAVNISAVEAAMHGCYLLLSDTQELLPHYHNLINNPFTAYNRNELLNLICNKPAQQVDLSMYNPAQCAQNLLFACNTFLTSMGYSV